MTAANATTARAGQRGTGAGLETNVIHVGDALAVLKTLPDTSVNCVVTSPPYFGLRDYGHADQIGLEPTPREYVEAMVAVFAEVRRVLTNDGTCWVNIGDSYSGSGKGGNPDDSPYKGFVGSAAREASAKPQSGRGTVYEGLPGKSLIGIPWRVAFGLQDDGWILRSDIIWSKPSCMPESVTDRPTRAHEYVFLLTKSPRYWYDAEAIREKFADARLGNPGTYKRTTQASKGANNDRADTGFLNNGSGWTRGAEIGGRNARSVWNISTEPTPFAHFATMPQKLVRRCIVAGCPVGGVVLDPFSGSGTTALVARREGRQYVGIELNPEYVAIAERRLAEPYTLPMLFADAAPEGA